MAAALALGTTVGELAGVLPLLVFGYLAAVLKRRGATRPLTVGVSAVWAVGIQLLPVP